jgi:hypothetical protein
LIVANQFTTQLSDEIRDAVFGNMGTIVSFRIGQNDVDSLSKYFQPLFDGDDLLRVPNYNTIVRTLVGGVPTQPFSMATLPPLGEASEDLAGALKQLSAAKYGRPKAIVEKEIFGRLATKEPPKQTFGASPFGGPAAGPIQTPAARPNYQPGQQRSAAPAAPAPPPSFLDDWLAKKKGGSGAYPPQPILSPPTATPASPQPYKPVAAYPPANMVPASPAGPAPALNTQAKSSGGVPPPLSNRPAPVPSAAPRVVENKEMPTVGATSPEPLAANTLPTQRKQSGELKINLSNGEPNEDTIFIDRDGTFHSKVT